MQVLMCSLFYGWDHGGPDRALGADQAQILGPRLSEPHRKCKAKVDYGPSGPPPVFVNVDLLKMI